jgi:hypothetical protein
MEPLNSDREYALSHLTFEELRHWRQLLRVEINERGQALRRHGTDLLSPASLFSFTGWMGKLRTVSSVLTGAMLGYRLMRTVFRFLR